MDTVNNSEDWIRLVHDDKNLVDEANRMRNGLQKLGIRKAVEFYAERGQTKQQTWLAIRRHFDINYANFDSVWDSLANDR